MYLLLWPILVFARPLVKARSNYLWLFVNISDTINVAKNKMPYQKLKQKITYLSQEEQKEVIKACVFASDTHKNQKRRTGSPYIDHCYETANMIADLKMDKDAIIAAILHDTVEDGPVQIAQIQKIFGKRVAILVDGVTKLGKIRITKHWFVITTKEQLADFDRQIETLRKMFVAMAKDIRVVIIKLADRLHNMKTIEGVEPQKRFRIAKETLDIYAPLAYRLGMNELKGQLEDLAFPIVYPDEYKWLKSQVKDAYETRIKYLEKVKKIVEIKLKQEKIKILQINGRAKHFYSLWRKLQRYDNDLSRIYDLVALRVIVPTIADCYKVLGIIHENWKPLVGRIKDYIAMPKPNGYQSLHTTVFCLDGKIVEFQIRTSEMHERAENGVAAGWHYSEAKGTIDYILRKIKRAPYEDIRWAKELAKWQAAVTDNKKLAKEIQVDFFSDRIFIYTPQGDVKDLPAGSTAIDFAYAIHSEVGNSCIGAKINGKLTSLNTQLKNGDIVEILKAKKSAGPKRDWLGFAKTTLARSNIKKMLKNS